MGNRCLLVILVSGKSLLPVPPASTIPFIGSLHHNTLQKPGPETPLPGVPEAAQAAERPLLRPTHSRSRPFDTAASGPRRVPWSTAIRHLSRSRAATEHRKSQQLHGE